jgi:predicted amino acid-binding ACT domain protein
MKENEINSAATHQALAGKSGTMIYLVQIAKREDDVHMWQKRLPKQLHKMQQTQPH